MIGVFAQYEKNAPFVRTGHQVKDYVKARAKALRLMAIQVEIRDEAKPRSCNLLALVDNRGGLQKILEA
jgi:hypothetical protein